MGFRGATRGQSEVIGAILIFAIIVALIGINQAFIVPDVNSEVEFQHSNDVERDMVDLRSGLIEAAASNEPRSRSIELGTDYPTRFLAVNPPPATGTLETRDAGVIESQGQEVDGEDIVSRTCATEGTATDTKSLHYQANYNEFSGSLPMTIENSVAYRQTGGDPLVNTGQILVQGDQINIIRVVGDVRETSSKSASIDLNPSETGVRTTDEIEGGFNVTVPTALDRDTWDRLLQQDSVSDVVEAQGGDGVRIELAPGDEYTIRCTTVGVNEEPDVEPVAVSDGDADGDQPNQINPFDSIRFKEAIIDDGSKNGTVFAEFENNVGEDVQITEARFTFYSTATQGKANPNRDPPETVIYENESFEIIGDVEAVNGDILGAGETEQLKMEFQDAAGDPYDVREGDWFVLFLGFEGTDTDIDAGGTYFVPPVEGEVKSEANFEINNLTTRNSQGDVEDTFATGEEVQFEVEIENTGGSEATQPITLDLDGHSQGTGSLENVDQEDLTLDSGESDTVTLVWNGAENNRQNQDETFDVTISTDDNEDTWNDGITVLSD